MAAQKMLLEPGGGWAHHRRLGTKRELPPWYEGYPYIEGGYRLGYDCADCARSVFRLHNETFIPLMDFSVSLPLDTATCWSSGHEVLEDLPVFAPVESHSRFCTARACP